MHVNCRRCHPTLAIDAGIRHFMAPDTVYRGEPVEEERDDEPSLYSIQPPALVHGLNQITSGGKWRVRGRSFCSFREIILRRGKWVCGFSPGYSSRTRSSHHVLVLSCVIMIQGSALRVFNSRRGNLERESGGFACKKAVVCIIVEGFVELARPPREARCSPSEEVARYPVAGDESSARKI